MRRVVLVLTCGLFVLAAGLSFAAGVGDVFNPQAPTFGIAAGATGGTGGVLDPMVIAVGHGGAGGAAFAPYGKSPTATASDPWTRLTLPVMGFSSNVVQATFGSASITRFFAEGTNGDILWAATSSSWTSFGAPTGGVTSSPAVAGVVGGSARVVVRGAGNVPWFRIINSAGQPGPWNQLGSTGIASAPGIAMSTTTPSNPLSYIVSLRSGGAIQIMQCNLITCTAWSDIPGNGTGVSQPTATWYPSTVNPGFGMLAVAVVGTTNRAYVNIFNEATGLWTSWVDRGGVCDSAVSVRPPLTAGAEPLLAVRGTGVWGECVNGGGQGWSCIGAP